MDVSLWELWIVVFGRCSTIGLLKHLDDRAKQEQREPDQDECDGSEHERGHCPGDQLRYLAERRKSECISDQRNHFNTWFRLPLYMAIG